MAQISDNLEIEIFQIKARQREYEMHDDWCDRREDQRNYASGWVMSIRDCNCWLVNER